MGSENVGCLKSGDMVGSENVGCLKKGKLSIDNVVMIALAGSISAASL